MQHDFRTNRLFLDKIDSGDAEFIFELVNTPGWIKFIGDRNIKTKQDANKYIQKRLNDSTIHYWVVKLAEKQIPIGIITFIKREYLEHFDIGFAFLPGYAKQGYAYEASSCVLNALIKNSAHTRILAITIKENTSSIRLLKKLGLQLDKEIKNENETLLVYSIATDKSLIDELTTQFFGIFTNACSLQPHWELIHTLCVPQTIIIKKTNREEEVYTPQTFIEPRKKILADGTLTEFEEKEIHEETKIEGHLAQRFSKYEKRGHLHGKSFIEYGNKFFQFIKTHKGWKINAVIWEDEKN